MHFCKDYLFYTKVLILGVKRLKKKKETKREKRDAEKKDSCLFNWCLTWRALLKMLRRNVYQRAG